MKITDHQNRPIQNGTDKTVARAGDATTPAAQTGKAGSGSPVNITEQARQLAALEQAVRSAPVVNESRVAEIRGAIENGRYQINPERVADQLLRTEQELAGR